MLGPQGLAFWPGVQQIAGCNFTLALGVTPGVASLTISPQSGLLATSGTLSFTFGGTHVVSFPDCKIDSGSLAFNGSHQIVSLSIFDRRWKWKFPTISGKYNQRRADGELVSDPLEPNNAIKHTERTPRQLAALCLEAMGEQGFNVQSLPNETRPQVNWDENNAARALEDLCESSGCRVCLGINNRVKIVRLGVGNPLPAGPVTELTEELNPPERPDRIEVVSNYIRYQADFELEAVGKEFGGEVKAIDDLGYRPGGGWVDESDIFDFSGVAEASQELAKETVYRWYRVKAPFELPGFGQVADIRQITPLLTEQVATFEEDGITKNRPAIVYGRYYADVNGNNVATVTPVAAGDDSDSQLVKSSWSIDRERGIVKFSEPMYIINPDDKAVPAVLRLRTSTLARDGDNGQYARLSRGRALPGDAFNTKPRVDKRDEIKVWYRGVYNDNLALINTENNLETAIPEMNHNLAAIEQEYRVEEPSAATYSGLHAVPPDGALQSISWSVTKAGAFTKVQRNQDIGTPFSLSWKRRREIQKNREAQRIKDEITAFGAPLGFGV